LAHAPTRRSSDLIADWSRARADLCLASELERRARPTDNAARACYEERRETLAALVTMFADASPHVVRRSVQAATLLPPLEACADDLWLQTRPAPPVDPQRRAELAAIRVQRSE